VSTLEDRLREIMTAMSWSRQDLIRVTGQSSSVVSQWLGGGSKPIHSIGRIEAALAIERESGFLAAWVAKGIGPKRKAAAPHWQTAEPGAPYAATPVPADVVVERLAQLLDQLDPAKQGPALQALTALVTAPDSAKARAAVLRAISSEVAGA
jgi:transcriptional regulator with XRE-family HTH domain